MLEIKFRGLRAINNKWAYGDIHFNPDRTLCHIHENGDRVASCQVLPETVGMWTGFDSPLTHHGQGYGVEIYKDDIVTWERHSGTGSTIPEIGWIDWSKHRGAWVMRWKEDGRELCINLADILECNKIIIIGNIHQNPELLK